LFYGEDLSQECCVIKKQVQHVLAKLHMSVNVTLEVLKCLVSTRTFISVRHMNTIMQAEEGKNMQVHCV
jgi:hypothetical protein